MGRITAVDDIQLPGLGLRDEAHRGAAVEQPRALHAQRAAAQNRRRPIARLRARQGVGTEKRIVAVGGRLRAGRQRLRVTAEVGIAEGDGRIGGGDTRIEQRVGTPGGYGSQGMGSVVRIRPHEGIEVVVEGILIEEGPGVVRGPGIPHCLAPDHRGHAHDVKVRLAADRADLQSGRRGSAGLIGAHEVARRAESIEVRLLVVEPAQGRRQAHHDLLADVEWHDTARANVVENNVLPAELVEVHPQELGCSRRKHDPAGPRVPKRVDLDGGNRIAVLIEPLAHERVRRITERREGNVDAGLVDRGAGDEQVLR